MSGSKGELPSKTPPMKRILPRPLSLSLSLPSPATGALCSSLPVDASGAPQVICERVVHEVQLLRVGELAVRRKQLPIGAAA